MKIQNISLSMGNCQKKWGPPDLPCQNIGTPAAGCVKDIIYVKYYSVVYVHNFVPPGTGL